MGKNQCSTGTSAVSRMFWSARIAIKEKGHGESKQDGREKIPVLPVLIEQGGPKDGQAPGPHGEKIEPLPATCQKRWFP